MTKLISLQQAMPDPQLNAVLSERTPCDTCTQQICNSKTVACWDYAHYIQTGNVRNRDRNPSAHIYKRMMSS